MFKSNINDEKPLASIITGDFNARSKRLRPQDVTNSHWSIIDTLTSTSGYYRLINLPTHMTNASSSCIDLVFTSNPNLITEFGIEKCLYAGSCHHSIVFGKTNLNVSLPPPYTCDVWDYNKGDKKSIQESIKTCNWARLFITINEKVELLSDTLINIFRNYIPNKKAKFKYGEAPWMNKIIKSAFRKRSRLTNRYYVNDQVQSDYNLL